MQPFVPFEPLGKPPLQPLPYPFQTDSPGNPFVE